MPTISHCQYAIQAAKDNKPGVAPHKKDSAVNRLLCTVDMQSGMSTFLHEPKVAECTSCIVDPDSYTIMLLHSTTHRAHLQLMLLTIRIGN